MPLSQSAMTKDELFTKILEFVGDSDAPIMASSDSIGVVIYRYADNRWLFHGYDNRINYGKFIREDEIYEFCLSNGYVVCDESEVTNYEALPHRFRFHHPKSFSLFKHFIFRGDREEALLYCLKWGFDLC